MVQKFHLYPRTHLKVPSTFDQYLPSVNEQAIHYKFISTHHLSADNLVSTPRKLGEECVQNAALR